MPEVIRFAKGTASEHLNFTGENGEITLICDDTPNRKVTGVIRLHDGQTVGGIPFGGSQLLNDMHDVNAANTIEFQVMTVDANGQFYFANTVETIADGTISGDKIYGGTISTSAAIFEGSSANAIVRITQTGSGNALVVEDSTNPDSTPFVVDSSGRVGIGTNSPSSYNSTGNQLVVAGSDNTGITIKSGSTAQSNIYFSNSEDTNVDSLLRHEHSTAGLQLLNLTTGGTLSFGTRNSGATYSERIGVDSDGNVTVNDASVDMDFRVESINSTHALFVDASGDYVSFDNQLIMHGGERVRRTAFSIPVDTNRRVRVTLTNYQAGKVLVMGRRTNAGSSFVYWEGFINNNNNTGYSEAIHTKTSSGTISYTFTNNTNGTYDWDFNNHGSGATGSIVFYGCGADASISVTTYS